MSSCSPTPASGPPLVPHPSPGKMVGQLHHLTLTVYFSNDIFPVGKTLCATLMQDGRTKEQLSGRHQIAPVQGATLDIPHKGWWLLLPQCFSTLSCQVLAGIPRTPGCWWRDRYRQKSQGILHQRLRGHRRRG